MIYSTTQQLSAIQDERVTAHSHCSGLGREIDQNKGGKIVQD